MLSTRRLASTWHGLVASEQRRGIEARRGDQRGPAGEPGGSLRVQARRRADPRRRPGRRQRPGPRARHARRPSRPSGDRDDPPREQRDGRCPSTSSRLRRRPASPDDLVWRLLGIKTLPVSTDYVASVSPKLRGGLYVQAVSPGSPAAQAAIQKGDILVGMNVGTRHWETIRADNILYVLRQPETDSDPERTALRRPAQRHSAPPDQPRRLGHAVDPEPVRACRGGLSLPVRISGENDSPSTSAEKPLA